jgi:hypothetical protein
MSTPQAQTTTDQNKQIILHWFREVWNEGRRETIEELFSPEGVLHDGPASYHGREEFYRFYDEIRSEFSEFEVKEITLLAEGDLVVSVPQLRLGCFIFIRRHECARIEHELGANAATVQRGGRNGSKLLLDELILQGQLPRP